MIVTVSRGLFADVVSRLDAKSPADDFSELFYDDRYGFRTKYGVFNTILEEKRPAIEAVVGEQLYPTYSMLQHIHGQGLIPPTLGSYTQDVAVMVPIRLSYPDAEHGCYDGADLGSFTLGIGDAFICDGFRVVKWLFPLPEGNGYNLYAKFNYIRKSDPCAELLRWDGYPDMFGEGMKPDRLKRTQPDFYDRMNAQCARNHGTDNWDRRQFINEQFDGWLAERAFPVLTGGPPTEADTTPDSDLGLLYDPDNP